MKHHKLGKRAFSFLLALCLAALPVQAFAEKGPAAPEEVPEDSDETDLYGLEAVEAGEAALTTPRAAYGSISTADVISIANSLIQEGYPYVTGGRSPSDGGFDCSGLIYYIYHTRLGADVTYQQIYDRSAGVKVEDRADFQTGDLVFGLNQYGGWHTGIFVGGNTMIHAGVTNGVSRTSMNGWFTVKYARRLPEVMQGPPHTDHVKGSYLWPEALHPHYNYFTCSVCGATFTDGTTTRLESCSQCQAESHVHVKGAYLGYLDAHPHHSCFSCAECGKTFSDDSTSNFDPHCSICHPSHTWLGPTFTKEPTFTSYGECTFICIDCHEVMRDTTPMLDSVTAQYSDNIRMTYHRNGLLQISGIGELTAPSQGGDGCVSFSLPGFEMEDYLDQVTRVQIGEGITALKGSVFGRMDNLEAIELPDSLTYLERHNFYLADGYPRLKSIHIPSGVSMMEGNWLPENGGHFTGSPFKDCSFLLNITVDPRNLYFSDQGGVLFDKSGQTLLFYPHGRTGYYDVPCGVTRIASDGFSYCPGLTTAVLPNGLTAIGPDAFRGCSSLDILTLPGSAELIALGAFAQCGALRDVYYGGTAEQWAAITISSGNEPLQNARLHPSGTPYSPSGSTMGPNNELAWTRTGRTLTVTGPVSAAEPLWAASYDKSGKLLDLATIASSGGSANLPAGAASCRLIWLDSSRAPRCESGRLSLT